MKIEYNTCDRCGTRIEYTGWTSFLYGLQPKKIKWRKIFNGNPSGYDYSDQRIELCAACTELLKSWLEM